MNDNSDTTSQPPEVKKFDHILMWPLLLHDTRDPHDRDRINSKDKRSRTEQILDLWDEQITKGCSSSSECKHSNYPSSNWKRRPHTVRADYREVLYFHPFVRNFLYDQFEGPDAKTPTRTGVRIYDRDDIRGVRISLPGEVEPIDLYVRRVSLYLFDSFVAIVVVEISNEWVELETDPHPERAREKEDKPLRTSTNLSLSQVLKIQETFRRIYPPFWMGNDESPDEPFPGVSPNAVQWLHIRPDKDCQCDNEPVGLECQRASSNFSDVNDFQGFVKDCTESPVARHWQFVMHPLIPFRGEEWKHEPNCKNNESWLAYQQIEDERAPVMTFLALDDPRTLTDAEWTRLAFLDSASFNENRDAYPYAEKFLKNWDADQTYERFWNEQKLEGQPFDMTTRYLCCGYAFVMVGKADGFFDNPHVMRHHFRAHYFKLGLIAQFQRASLLSFSDQLSNAIIKKDRGDDRLFRIELKRIQNDFLTFRSRFWFTEVSNHVQGRELFEFWTKHLGTEKLFDQILDEIRTINDVQSTQEQDELGRIGERFTVVATIGLFVALALPLIELFRDQGETFAISRNPHYRNIGLLIGLLLFGLLVLYRSSCITDCFRWMFGWRYEDQQCRDDEYSRSPRYCRIFRWWCRKS